MAGMIPQPNKPAPLIWPKFVRNVSAHRMREAACHAEFRGSRKRPGRNARSPVSRSVHPGSSIRLLRQGIFCLALLLADPLPLRAQSAVDLQLVLAVDASGSVDQFRFELQKRGYAAAFRHERVQQAVRSGPTQSIAVTMLQWTGPALQVQVVGWRRVADAETAAAFAAEIERAPRRLFGGGTSISGALDYAVTLFAKSPFRAMRRVIDVSGDGSNNRGRAADFARDDAVAAGMAINGLPILALEPDLDRYYYEHVIGGPAAFVIAAQNYESFADAILKKMILEIAATER